MYTRGYICLSEGVHLRFAVEEKNKFTYYLFPNTYISLNNICKNPHVRIVKYIYE